MKLSIIIPVYNEENTLEEIINKIAGVPIDREIVIVDDGSGIHTKHILEEFKKQYGNDKFKIIYREKNGGKGEAIKTGLSYINSDVVIIQDADLEYEPSDYLKLLSFLDKENVDIVYGSRFLTKQNRCFNLHYLANYTLTLLTNLLYNSRLTDMETCYKLIKKDIIKELSLESKGFEIEAEITGKLLKKRYKIFEIPINYTRRRYSQGKKIGWKDGVKAILTLIKYRFG